MVDLSLKQTKHGYSIKLKTSRDVETFMQQMFGPPRGLDPYTHIFSASKGRDYLMAYIQCPQWLDHQMFNQFNRPFETLSLFQLAGTSEGLILRPRQGQVMPFEQASEQVHHVLERFHQFYQFFRRHR